MKIAVIILNYNGIDDTIDCLKSIRTLEKDGNNLEIIVVDNNSSDGSQEVLSKLKDIHLIKNSSNLGYSGGNNVGIKYVLKKNSDFILILNNDTVVDKRLLMNLVEAAKSADIISPKIYFSKGYEFRKSWYRGYDLGKVIWYAGGNIDWVNIIGKHIGVDEVDKNQYDKPRETDFATGACMFVKSEVLKKIGLFDEKYFLYLEDMDFCTRAQKAGFKIIYEPRAIIFHKNAQSVQGSGSELQDYFITRNRLLFALKFARLRTKLAVFKQVATQLNNPIKRRAFLDFITGRFGKGTYI